MSGHLLLLHGALGSKEQFSELRKLLDKYFTTHAFNFEGHGGEDSENDFSMDLFSQNISGFIRTNKIEGCNVFGYSMGGYAALKVAEQFPGIINKIMTLGTKFNWNPETAAKEIRMLDPQKILEKVPQFAETLRKAHSPSDWKIVMNKTAAMIERLGNSKSELIHQPETILNEILIAVGSEDKMVTRDESQNMADRLKNGKMIILNSFHHPFETADVDVLGERIINFMTI